MMEDNDNRIIKQPHIVLTDGRQKPCVVRKKNSEMEQINITPYDWVVVLVFHLLTQYVVVL
jgi:hypothetical protein